MAAVLVVCSFLVFVPIRHVYPTRTVVFRRISLTLTTLWPGSYAVILWQVPDPHPATLTFSVLYLSAKAHIRPSAAGVEGKEKS
ncbi:hypothetical protein [Rubrobacter tropicus]|uniref:hypothetical protein n=1 Tax=Rubrobacter tropicus TaxID=2653851 RepID=UPI001A9E1E22|nr:hypothetical protein [Rubrobacter tropicus]